MVVHVWKVFRMWKFFHCGGVMVVHVEGVLCHGAMLLKGTSTVAATRHGYGT